MSNSSDRNNESSLCEQNEIKTTNDQRSPVGEQSTELGSNLKNKKFNILLFSWNK